MLLNLGAELPTFVPRAADRARHLLDSGVLVVGRPLLVPHLEHPFGTGPDNLAAYDAWFPVLEADGSHGFVNLVDRFPPESVNASSYTRHSAVLLPARYRTTWSSQPRLADVYPSHD